MNVLYSLGNQPVTCPGYSFVPVSNIKSCVLYTQAEVNYGRVIGSDAVTVVVPFNMLYIHSYIVLFVLLVNVG